VNYISLMSLQFFTIEEKFVGVYPFSCE